MRYGKYFQDKYSFQLDYPDNPSPKKKRKLKLFKRSRRKIKRQKLRASSTHRSFNTVIFITTLMTIIYPSPFLINLGFLVGFMAILFFIKCTLNLFEKHQVQYSTRKARPAQKHTKAYSLIHYVWIAIPFAITSHIFQMLEAQGYSIITSVLALSTLLSYALYQRSRPLDTKNDCESLSDSQSL